MVSTWIAISRLACVLKAWLALHRMTDLAPVPSQRVATLRRGECSSGESKVAKRPRRAANAARELVQDIAQSEGSDSDEGETRPRVKAAKRSATCSAGAGARPKLPRPEGIACCPRCKSEDTKFCYYNNYNIKQPRFFCKVLTAPGTLADCAASAAGAADEQGIVELTWRLIPTSTHPGVLLFFT